MEEESGLILVVDWLGALLGPIWRTAKAFFEKRRKKAPEKDWIPSLVHTEGFWKRKYVTATGE